MSLSRFGKRYSRNRLGFHRRKRASRRGVATAIGSMLFFIIALQLVAYLYEVNQVNADMINFDIERARETVQIQSVGFNDHSPSSIQISSGQQLSGSISSLEFTDSDRFILSSEQELTTLHPFSYTLLGSTQFVSGGTSNLVSDDGTYMRFRSYVSSFSATSSTNAFIGYRSNTGTFLTNSSKGSSWDGNSWSSEEELPDAGSPVRWVRVSHSLTSASFYERIVVTLSDDGYLDAYVWDGSSWLYQTVGGQDLGFIGTVANSYRPFDIAYESSGDAMLVYGISSTDTTRDLAYRIWDGNSWSAEAYLDDTTSTADIQYYWVRLASYPLSTGRVDEIALIGLDGTGIDANAWIWDGNVWGNSLELTNDVKRNTEEDISVAYEQVSGDVMFIWGQKSDLRSRKWAGSWQAQLPNIAIGGEARWFTLKADPTSNMLMAVAPNKDLDLITVRWDGSAWTLDPAHDVEVDSITTRVADFEWEISGGKGLLVWGTTTGSISWRTFTAPSTWDTVSTETNSGTHPWVQLARNPRDVNGDLKIAGATLNSDNDLYVFDWDGVDLNFQPVLSTDVAGTTWESFDLSWRHFGDASYILEVEFTGSGGIDAGLLNWAIDSSWTVGDVNVTIQLFSYTNNQYADETNYGGKAYSNYESDSVPNTDQLEDDSLEDNGSELISDFFDMSTNWKIKIRGEKESEVQFDLRVDLVEYELEENISGWLGIFSVTESPSLISGFEVTFTGFGQAKNAFSQEILIYNFTGLGWDSLANITITVLEATAGPLITGGLASDYVDGSSQVKVSVNGTSTDSYSLYSNYLHLRIIPLGGNGIITIEIVNSGGNDIHLVDLWIINGSNVILRNKDSSPAFDAPVFPGETLSTSIPFDWKTGESYRIKVVSERGGIWSKIVSP